MFRLRYLLLLIEAVDNTEGYRVQHLHHPSSRHGPAVCVIRLKITFVGIRLGCWWPLNTHESDNNNGSYAYLNEDGVGSIQPCGSFAFQIEGICCSGLFGFF